MKNLIVLLCICLAFSMNAQISFDHSYKKPVTLNKLHVSGYKYQEIDLPGKTIKLYDLNHALYKSIPVPTLPGTLQTVGFVTENLFDNDNLIEFIVITFTNISTNTMVPLHHATFYIFKENGNQLFMKDSAMLSPNTLSNVFANYESIFSEGTATKMKLSIYNPVPNLIRTDVYTLPGTIPCVMCSSGIVTGRSVKDRDQEEIVFYPNPVSDQLKLKYTLPEQYKSAQIDIHDMQGKLLETFKLTDTFDHILLPSSYDNGMYFYTLTVDGEKLKTEKIVLSK